MRGLSQRAFRWSLRNPSIRNGLGRFLGTANKILEQLNDDRYSAVYSEYRDYTRLPEETYLLNLGLVERLTNVDGCVVECGVWRGGMSAGMATVLGSERAYYLFDSFEGLPDPISIDGAAAIAWQDKNQVENCRTDEAYAREAMDRSRATDATILKGWFSDTLEGFTPSAPIAVLRLDADWYSSTAECLNNLYPHVAEGGLVLVDDYFAWDGCARAIHDYLSANALADRIETVNQKVAYFLKKEDRPFMMIDPHRVFEATTKADPSSKCASHDA